MEIGKFTLLNSGIGKLYFTNNMQSGLNQDYAAT